MSIIFMESFEGLPLNDGDFIKNSGTISTNSDEIVVTDTICKTGSRCLFASKQEGFWVNLGQEIMYPNYVTVGFHFYYNQVSDYGHASDYIVNFNTYYFNIVNNKIRVSLYPDDAVRYGSIDIPLGAWYYFVIQYCKDNENGFCNVWVNGIQDISYTGDTRYSTTGLSRIIFNGNVSSSNSSDGNYFDNIWILKNELITDEVFIDTVLPNSAGNYSQWTPSAGNNFECVDDSEASMTDYVQTDTIGNKDTYNFNVLSPDVGTVHGVGTSVFMNKDDLGNRTVKQITRIGETDYEGDVIGVPSGSTVISEYWDQNPATATDWTKDDVENAEFGIKLES